MTVDPITLVKNNLEICSYYHRIEVKIFYKLGENSMLIGQVKIVMPILSKIRKNAQAMVAKSWLRNVR